MVPERARGRASGQPAADQVGGVPAALDRHLGHSRQVVDGHHVADREDLRMSGYRAVRFDLDAPGPVGGRPGGLRELLRQRRGGHPGRPDLRQRLDALAALSGLQVDAGRVHVDHAGAQPDLNTKPVQLGLRLGRQPVAEGRQHRVERVQ